MWPFSKISKKRCNCSTLAVKQLGYEPMLQRRDKLRVTTHCSACNREATTVETYLPLWDMPAAVGAAGFHKDAVLMFYNTAGGDAPSRLDYLYPKAKRNRAVQFKIVGHELPWVPDSYVEPAAPPTKPKLALVPMPTEPAPEPPKKPEVSDAAVRFGLLDLK